MTVSSSTFTVVGASADPEKYGYKVLENLLARGLDAVGVNPKGGTLLDRPVYTNLAAVAADRRSLGTVVMVVPPTIAASLVADAARLGADMIWCQPGSESDEAIAACAAAGMRCIHHACIMRTDTVPTNKA